MLACPIPLSDYPEVLLAHGGGGKLTHDLLERLFLPTFSNPHLEARHDGAVLELDPGRGGGRLAFTTDAHVVRPLFFPGGDIGRLAVCGTLNDLAMCGARPMYLSAAFILEEGLPMETLWRVVMSMGDAARGAGVSIVTGDTKVVDRGKGDGVFISTAGVGRIEHGLDIRPSSIRPGDAIVLSSDVGRHGMAVLAARESLSFESGIRSDCANLAPLVLDLLEAGLQVHCLRDLTRGGLATGLLELALGAGLRLDIEEAAIPVRENVHAACEILGLDPLYVANEGCFACVLPEAEADRAVELLRRRPEGSAAVRIGAVAASDRGRLILRTRLGTERLLTMLSGEQLPRIC